MARFKNRLNDSFCLSQGKCDRTHGRLPATLRFGGDDSFLRRLGRELRSAHAQAAARVLPELLGRVQAADGAGDGAEIVFGEAQTCQNGPPRRGVVDLVA